MAVYFISDIHLKPEGDARTDRLLRWLKSLRDIRELYLMGDIFDFWMGGHAVWLHRYRGVVGAFRELQSRGVVIHFFEGNHDIHIDPFFTKELGVSVSVEPKVKNFCGYQVRLEHGDLFDPTDRGYFFLRGLLRSRAIRWTSIHAPGGLVTLISDWATAASHKRTSVAGRRPEVVEDIRRKMRLYFEKASFEEDFDLLIMGHTHVREDFTEVLGGRTRRFVNLGSWYDNSPHAFVIDGNRRESVPIP